MGPPVLLYLALLLDLAGFNKTVRLARRANILLPPLRRVAFKIIKMVVKIQEMVGKMSLLFMVLVVVEVVEV